jgi:hypothetical protein
LRPPWTRTPGDTRVKPWHDGLFKPWYDGLFKSGLAMSAPTSLIRAFPHSSGHFHIALNNPANDDRHMRNDDRNMHKKKSQRFLKNPWLKGDYREG